jgi:hypothetical protein
MRARICAAIESLALALWIGALAGFAFVFAPAAFHVVTDTGEFATLIGRVLTQIGLLGGACGSIAIIAIVIGGAGTVRTRTARILIVAVMLALSAYVTSNVIPEMEATAKSFNAPFASIAKTDPRRVRYDELHQISSRAYALVLILGAAAIVLAAASPGSKDRGAA